MTRGESDKILWFLDGAIRWAAIRNRVSLNRGTGSPKGGIGCARRRPMLAKS
jgi:hypothetical protein